MRTVVNARAGGRTPLSGVIHALLLLGVMLGLGRFAAYIPHAVLAGILIKVGIDIIDWDYLRRVGRAPVAGVVFMFVVLLLTVLVGVKPRVEQVLTKLGAINRVDLDARFGDRLSALRHAATQIEQQADA